MSVPHKGDSSSHDSPSEGYSQVRVKQIPVNVIAFVDECCILSPTAQMIGADLLQVFMDWRGFRCFGPALRETTWDALCTYLGSRGCTRDLTTDIAKGVALKPGLSFTLPSDERPNGDSDESSDSLSWWCTLHGQEALMSNLLWIKQRADEQQHQFQEIVETIESASVHEALESVDIYHEKIETYRNNLIEHYKQYMDARAKSFALSMITIPSVEEIRLACAWMIEWKEKALESPLVREIISFLRILGETERVPIKQREFARDILQHIFSQMLPSIKRYPAISKHHSSFIKRYMLLSAYNREYIKLHNIMKKQWRNPAARLLALREAYPDIPQEELQRWRSQKCALIAQGLVGRHFGLTAQTVGKLLQKSRKERLLIESWDENSGNVE